MNAIKKFFAKVKELFTGANAKADAYFSWILKYIPEALPIIEYIAALTPTAIDDAALALVRAKFPKLFDPDLTEDEKKLYLLGAAGELLKQKYPALSTTAARIAVQVAYGVKKIGDWLA
ncbi:MAG TPA: hypothetical protein VFI02_06180 [Armatimonadota bacterium]|nr:hypothetical protein [Armatimonadota bacterium]